jgi:hypothetical protein
MTLDTWTTQLSEALGIEAAVEIDDVLDIARDAAHQVDRPAAPLTTFLIGYAAAMRGGSARDITDCIDLAAAAIEGAAREE